MQRYSEFERLDAYVAALEFIVLADAIAVALKGRAYLASDLRRAANSVAANLAEGSGERGAERARFYRMARRSALESASHIMVAHKLDARLPAERALDLLHRIVSMLTAMARRALADSRQR